MALDRYTINQSKSAGDYCYQAALHCLAMVAANPDTLPSYALLSGGISSITDTGTVNPLTLWGKLGGPDVFVSETLAFTGSRTPQLSWTISPVGDDTQLEAMRCACRWVLAGPDHLGPECTRTLADPEEDPSPGPHFGVMRRLVRLPKGWLHVGGVSDVPLGACYKDHCCGTWVWVMPDGTEGLAEFTLVLQDIATLNYAPSDGSWPANRTPPLLVTLWVIQDPFPKAGPKAHKAYSQILMFRLDRVIRPEYKCKIEEKIQEGIKKKNVPVDISMDEWMAWTTPYQGQRAAVKPGSQSENPFPIIPRTRTLSPQYRGFRMGPSLNPTDFTDVVNPDIKKPKKQP
jgi:hypothetical protein